MTKKRLITLSGFHLVFIRSYDIRSDLYESVFSWFVAYLDLLIRQPSEPKAVPCYIIPFEAIQTICDTGGGGIQSESVTWVFKEAFFIIYIYISLFKF